MPDDLDSIIAALPNAGKVGQRPPATDLDSIIAALPDITPKKESSRQYPDMTMGQRVKAALVGPGTYAANAPKQTFSEMVLNGLIPGYAFYKDLTGPAGGKPVVDISALQLEKSPALTDHPAVRGAIEAGESFAGGLTTPRSIGMLAGLEELKLAGSAVSLLKNPVVKRTLMGAAAGVNLYLTYQMAHGMGDRGKAALEAYNKHDYETMSRELGAGGVDAMFAALGIRNLARNAFLTDPLKPGMARDLSGKPEPEVLPKQAEVGSAPEKAPETSTRAVQTSQRDPSARQRGETPAEWEKRTMAGKSPAPVVPVKEPAKAQAATVGASPQVEQAKPPSHPAVLPVVAGQPKEAPRLVKATNSPLTEQIAPVTETKPSTLPANLSGAKPRYSYGKKQFDLEFESDLDKARYIAARPNKSKSDQAYVDFVKKETGLDESAIRSQGNDIRSAIKSVAKDAEPGKLTVPKDVWRKTTKEVVAPTETKPTEPETEHKFSTTHVTLPEEVAGKVKSLGDKIPKELLAEDGRESDPHITVKYGLHGDEAEKVRDVLKDQPPIQVKLGETSLFSNPDADVIKINVDSPDLHALNKKIADALPHTDTHPDYKPHVTVAYVKPGQGSQFVGDKSLSGQSVELNSLTFSDRNGNKVDIPLEGKATTPVDPVKTDMGRKDVAPPLKLKRPKGQTTTPIDASRAEVRRIAMGLPEPAKDSTVPAVEPKATEAPAVERPANPGLLSHVNTIFDTAKGYKTEKIHIQRVEAEGKPTGEPVEMNIAGNRNQEIKRVMGELGDYKGFVTMEPVGENPTNIKWGRSLSPTNIDTEEPAVESKEVKPGSSMVNTRGIRGYKKGTKFTLIDKVPEGYVMLSPRAETFVVSPEDFSTFRQPRDTSGERGSFSLRRTKSEDPKRYWSWYRAKIKNSVIRALSQTEVASPEVHAALVKTENSRAQSSAAMHVYVPRIVEALGKGPDAVSWDTFRQALVENVLRGKEEMWNDMVELARNLTDDQLEKDMKEYMISLLSKAHFDGGEPANVATALLDRKDFNGLREVLKNTFAKAADNVASVMDPAEYDKTVNSESFKRGLTVYKSTLEKSFKENHLSNEGVLSDWLGDLDTYMPLIPITDAEARAAVGGVSRVAFNKPVNTANRMAGGLADSYSWDVSDIAKRFASTHYQNNRAAARQLAEDVGLLQRVGKDDPEPDRIWFKDRWFIPKKVQVTKDLDIPTKQGMKKGINHVPGQYMITPEWFHNEAITLLSRDAKIAELYNPNNIAAKITQAALIGPTDVVVHGSYLVGVVAARTPFMGDSLTGRVVGAFPFVKRAAATYNVIKNGINGTASTLDAAQDIMDMAEYGGISEKFGSETYSPEYAAMTGAKLVGPVHGKGMDRISMSPILYGPNGADINARLMIHRAMKKMMPDATQTERYLAVNQLGNFTRSLQGSWERFFKSTMLSPFATTGMTMNRNGVNTVFGMGPQVGYEKSWFEQHITFNSALITTITWALANKAYTGKWPWDELDSKLLKIRVRPEHQNTEIGRMLCGGSSKKGSCYLDVGLSNPIAGRGFRATGLQAAYDTTMAGGSSDQVAEAMLAQAISTAVSPILNGPPSKMLFLGIGGVEPTITGFTNAAGQPGIYLFPATLPQKHGMAGFAKKHLVAPFIGMNSLMTNAGAATGLTDGIMRESPHGTLPERWGHLGFNLIIPNLTSMSHPEEHRKFLSNQRKAEDRAARKRELSRPAIEH